MPDERAREKHEASSDVALTREEQKQVKERARPRAALLYETIRTEGELELHRPASALAWSGLAAGLSMGFSLATTGWLRAALPDTRWRSLISSFGYCVGFLIVILGRQQLFTENTLTPVLALLQRRDRSTLWLLLRLWSLVLLSNLLGALIFAFVASHTSVFEGDARSEFAAIGREALEGSFGLHILRGILSGWIIALIVWILPGIDTAGSFVIVLFTYLIALGRLSHVIAGSVDVLYCVVSGETTWSAYWQRFFLPVLLGNMTGGIALVAALSHAQIAADQREGA